MLPKIPNKSTKRSQEIVAFRGLNRTENTQDGEVGYARNMSTAKFPCLSQREKRVEMFANYSPTDIFAWDGRLFFVSGSILYVVDDGDPVAITNLSEAGPKQFSVVNTKLCIWPDKKYVDLTNMQFGYLDASFKTSGGSNTVTITNNSFTASLNDAVAVNQSRNYTSQGGDLFAYFYGSNETSVAACCKNGQWDMAELEALQNLEAINNINAPITAGSIFIPSMTNNAYEIVTGQTTPDTSLYNDMGYYAIVRTANVREELISGATVIYSEFTFDVYNASNIVSPKTSSIKIDGLQYIYTYGKSFDAVIDCWDAQNSQWDMNALAELQTRSFLFMINTGMIIIPSSTLDMVWSLSYPDTSQYNNRGYFAVIRENSIDWPNSTCTYEYYVYSAVDGTMLFSGSFRVGDSVSFTNMPSGADVIRAIIRGIDDGTNTLTFDANTFPVTGTYSDIITIKRDVPNLDYVCEKDNRLWGVSNTQTNEIWDAETGEYRTFTSRAIYASALGDPTNWWVFDGVDSDSYQVAVGSEGDFTGICAYGGAVLAWKEDTLYKILGSYPSEYYMHISHIEGVAKGSSRSMTVVNEVLYYNGATGVYAYTGATPSLIGYPLGTLYKNAAGGSNGLRWYLSGTKPDGAKELVVYDLTHRIWTQEDDIEATGFATIGSDLYMCTKNNNVTAIYKTEQGIDDYVPWAVEFIAFDETALIRKYYLRILLRLEFIYSDYLAAPQAGVYVKYDNDQEWKLIKEFGESDSAVNKIRRVYSFELPVKRCDRMWVKIAGRGNVLIRDMTREYIAGSERP